MNAPLSDYSPRAESKKSLLIGSAQRRSYEFVPAHRWKVGKWAGKQVQVQDFYVSQTVNPQCKRNRFRRCGDSAAVVGGSMAL